MREFFKNTVASGMLVTAFSGPAFADDHRSDDLEVQGFVRTHLEVSQDGYVSDQLPNLILNTQIGGTKLSGALDVYDVNGPISGGHEARLFWLNARVDMPDALDNVCDTAIIGMQTPFSTTGYSNTLYKLVPTSLDNALGVNPGIAGVQCLANHDLGDHQLTTKAIAGTKSKAINKDFGAEDGPGFGALVAGGGLVYGADLSGGTHLNAGYHVLHFGEGNKDVSRLHQNAYVTIDAKVSQTQFKLHGEARKDDFSSGQNNLVTTFYGEAVTSVSETIDARMSAGFVDGDLVGGGALLFEMSEQDKVSGHVGIRHNANTHDTSAEFTLIKRF